MFWVYTALGKEKYKCETEFFCKIEEGDSIQANVEVIRNSRGEPSLMKLTQLPYICPATDKDSIVRCWITIIYNKRKQNNKIKGFGNTKAMKWFSKIAEQARSSSNVDKYVKDYHRDMKNAGGKVKGVEDSVLVAAYMSELAGMWCQIEDTRILDLLTFEDIITEGQVKIILYYWHRQRNIRRLWMFGLYTKDIKLVDRPWEEIYECCITNPYKLVQLEMEKCRRINSIQNKKATPVELFCAKVARRIYSNQSNNAWVCTPIENIGAEFPELATNPEYLQGLVKDYGVKTLYGGMYLEKPFMVEEYVANWLFDLIKKEPIDAEDAIFSSPHLSDQQRIAVQGALSNWICVINGGAGTGKTKTIGQILHNLDSQDVKYQVVSFTGKAVSHIKKALMRDNPMTMDKAIATSSRIEEFDVLIVDETSMVTIELMYRFKKAFPFDFRVVFVGDQNQLQPINWGALFNQVLETQMVPVFTLTKNYRADVIGVDCGIVDNSRRIIECSQTMNNFVFSDKTNFCIIPGNEAQVHDVLSGMRSQNENKNSVTILTPKNKYLPRLNKHFQNVFIPGARSVTDSQGIQWRIGDRVMMKQNDYDINIMNGEEGEVTDITDLEIYVTFADGAQHDFKLDIPQKSFEFDYSREQERTCKDIQHSGAMTIHKSQGSEWDCVIIYIPEDSSRGNFLNLKLLYTAITRARKMCILVGDRYVFESIASRHPSIRNDNLANRIRDLANNS